MNLRRWTVWLCLALTGCVTARLGSGQARWYAVETKHFRLYTDLPRADAERRADELERVLYALEHSAFEVKGELPLRLNVVMFRDQEAFDDFGRGKLGGYVIHEALFEPWMVMPVPGRQDGLGVLTHELTHHITYAAMQRQPVWFDEGLASYFESVRFEQGGTWFTVGRVPLHYHRLLATLRLIPPSELIQKQTFHAEPQYYASAWLLVHYLMTKRSEELMSYQSGLAKGVGFARAFHDAFQGLTLEQLDREVAAYFRDGLYETYSFRLAERPPTAMRTLTQSVADEHALAAILWRTCRRCPRDARARADESMRLALAADPLQLQARVLDILKTRDPEAAMAAARALTAAHPGASLAWLMLGFSAVRVEPATAENGRLADEAAQRALALAPTQPYAWMLRAIRLAAHGERAAALDAANRAQHLQRNAPNMLVLRAVLLARLNECASLRELIGRIREQPELAISAQNRGQLDKALQRCSTAP